MTGILMIWKRLPELFQLQARHTWEATFGGQLVGRTLGIVGTGAIGSALAIRAKAFGMHIIGTRRSYVDGMTVPGVDVLLGPDGLETLLRESDVVVLAAPSTPDTVDMIDAKALAMMKEQSVLINVGRGSLVDENALVDALSSGHLRAAVVDVVREEPLPPSSPLWDIPNLHISPHCAVSLDRYFENVLELFLENLGRYHRGATTSERCRRERHLMSGRSRHGRRDYRRSIYPSNNPHVK